MVDDLDLVHTRTEAGERVDEPLQAIVGLDDLLGRSLGERVRLVVEHQRPRPLDVEDVEPAVQEHAVVLERERPLGPGARQRRDPLRQLGVAVAVDERRDPRQLLLRHGRIPRAHLLQIGRRRRREVDELQQPVHGVADLGRDEPRLARDRPVRTRLPHPGDALGVVAVGAPLEERQRAVGEAAHVVQRRLRQRLDRRERGRERRQLRLRPGGEEGQLAGRLVDDRRHELGDGLARSAAASGRAGRARAPPPARARAGVSPVTPSSSAQSRRPSTQPIGVRSSAFRSGSIEPETIRRSIARVIAT